LSAVGELSGSPAAPSAIVEVATLSSVPLSKDAAERRQLMVMFCDLVGSTAMSAWLDPRTCAASSGPSFQKPIARPVMSEYQ
jgi:class 3 adenylate cyclase